MSREKFLKGQEIHRQRELERQFIKSVVDDRREELKKLSENGINLSSEIYDELKSYWLNPKDKVCKCRGFSLRFISRKKSIWFC